MNRKNLLLFSVLAAFYLTLTGFSIFGDEFTLSRHAQKKEHHQIIKMLAPRVEQGEELSAFKLLFLAGAYLEIRDYQKALAAADLMQKRIDAGDKTVYGSDISVYPLIFRGYIFLDQGDPQKAVAEGEKAYRLLNSDSRNKQGFYRSELISLCDFWGVALEITGRKEEASRLIGILNNIDSKDQAFAPEKYTALARIYMAKKDYANALAAVGHPEAKVSGWMTAFYDQTFQEIPKLYILSKSLFETGNMAEAKKGYDQLLNHPQIAEIGGIYWIALTDRAAIALAEGQKDLAEKMLKQAIEVIEKQRSSITTETGRIGFVGDKQTAYSRLVERLLETGRTAEAFTYVERAKARALVDLLASQKNFKASASGEKLVTEDLQQLALAERQMTVVPATENTEAQNKTRAVVVRLKKDLQDKDPQTAALVAVTAPAVKDIQNRLQPDETLLEYYVAGNNWYVFLLSRKNLTVYKLPVADPGTDIERLRQALTRPSSIDNQTYAHSLYRQLVAPFAPLLTTSKLVIVGHGPLHYLPFAALFDGKEYVVDRFSIRYLPSASVLTFLQSRAQKETSNKALILGNPKLADPKYDLAFAEDEARAIGKILPGSKILLRSEATATALSTLAGQYPLIHLAAHGVFNPDAPLSSALLLAPDKAGDGLLKASDLYSLSLNADLVTLSACETALGKVSTGDDVVGFTRGFLYAGAGSLVSSLWQVDDRATRDLMVTFYSHLKEMPKDEALRQAQISVKAQYPHPYYWAAFVLTGNGH